MSKTTKVKRTVFPLLPLRDVVVYPHMVVPLFVGREKSISALESAMADDKKVILVTQRDPAEDAPGLGDIYEVGTLATILQMLKLPDGTLKVLVEGLSRTGIKDGSDEAEFMQATSSLLESKKLMDDEADALIRSTNDLFEQYVNISKKPEGL